MGTPLVLTQQIDSATWQALGLVLTLVGLGVSVLVWRRAGAGRGLQAVALSLLPLAAGLTGVLRLAWEILDSVLRWAARLVFSPVVWLGLVVAVVALVLYLVGGVVRRRSSRSTAPAGRAELAPGGQDRHESTAGAPATSRRARRRQDDQVVEDQDDIEAILRRHGIG
jgi:uncharacterized membrane protein (UPF0136 family)